MTVDFRSVRRLGLALLAIGAIAACGDDDDNDNNCSNNPTAPSCLPGASGDTVVIGSATENTIISQSRTLSRDTTYVIQGFVKVVEPAILTIESGTQIRGDFETPGSALFVLQGAQINAVGSANDPIVMSSEQPVGQRQPGDWGGLIVVGRGQINRAGSVILEGTTDPAANAVPYSGGTNNGDNSGRMSYVRVEFAGYPVLPNAELNSFTLAALGSATRLDHLQAMGGLDDAFEWFGGAVDAQYLVSYETGDDHFDASEGFRGRNQFLIAYQDTLLPPRPGLSGGPSNDPQGFEVDGCDGAGCELGRASVPYTVPVFANFTVVGTGSATLAGQSGGIGMVLRRGAGGVYVNGIVARFPTQAITIRDAFTDTLMMRDSLVLRNILLAQNGRNFDADGSNFGQGPKFAAAAIDSAATVDGLFTALPANPASAAAIDWTPPTGSAAATGGLGTFPANIASRVGQAVTGTSYRGAAAPGGPKWWEGWTVYTRR
jgi:hypothetical protein